MSNYLRNYLRDTPAGAFFRFGRRAARLAKTTYAKHAAALRRQHVVVRDLGKHQLRQPVGRCLVSYTDEFVRYLNTPGRIGPSRWDPATLPAELETYSASFSHHSMYWESGELVRQFIERGYIVDCLFDRNGYLIDDVSEYDVIVDEWVDLPRWAASNVRAKTLHYATGCHWIFHNEAELVRLSWLFARRHVAVPSRRQVPPILGPGVADLISTFGSQANIRTFGAYGPKVRQLQISAVFAPSEPRPKAWQAARRRFLWFGGSGWVHKGLDLVVETFLLDRQLELIIVGGWLAGDETFWRIYGLEIEQAGNIRYLGQLDPAAGEFASIVDSVCAVVYPSAAEGCSGAIVQCLQYGLIPIVTEITGLGIHDDWPALVGDSDSALINDIRRRCSEIASLSEARLIELQHFFWNYARHNHTRAAYRQSLGQILDELLSAPERSLEL